MIPLLVVAVLAAGVLLSGRSGSVKPMIAPAEFGTMLKQAEDQAVPILGRHANGEDLSAPDAATLRTANEKLKGLQEANPRSIVPFFLAGKIDQVLGNGVSAEKELRQAIANIDAKSSVDAALQATRIEAHYGLSLVYFWRREYEQAYKEADIAVSAIPNSALYHAARASAAVQIGRTDEARADVKTALELDPKNPQARRLKLLLFK